MKDYLIKALSKNEEVRAFSLITTNLVEEVRKTHNYSPISIAALGRTLTMTLILGSTLKSEDDLVTVTINGDGPLKQILATSNNSLTVKGYVSNPTCILPPNKAGHLNVGGGIGKGTLTVIRDYKLKEPYISNVNLVSGEIAEDFTYYFAQSEQIPTAIGLGVLLNKDDCTIKASGGFMVQLMPFASESTIKLLEDNLKTFTSVTDILKQDKTPEDLLKIVMKGLDFNVTYSHDVFFKCSCSYEKGLKTISSLSKEQLEGIVKEGKDVTVTCDFCNKTYTYPLSEIKELLAKK